MSRPLPLMKSSRNTYEIPPEKSKSATNYGLMIIFFTWLIFIVGMGSMFDIWDLDWKSHQDDKSKPQGDFPITNYYVSSMLVSSTIIWIWSVISWVGMKLFRHSKGIGVHD